MKVLVITNMLPTPSSRSQGTFVRSQIESLRSRVEIDVLHIERVERGRRIYARAAARVRKAIQEGRPDVIHVMYGGALALLSAAAAGNTPLIVSICGSDLLGDPQPVWRQRVAGRLTVWASIIAALRADAVIAKSKQLADRMPRVISRRKIHVVPNGVDFDHFRPLDTAECRRILGWSEDEFHVLFTGAPGNGIKRFRDAQDAVECVRARGVPARLQLMRNIPYEQVPIWINAAHVMMLCSIHEGSPNIVKESLACEYPVISTDVADVAERIEGIEGCHLSSGNKTDLANCLEAVFQRGRRLECRNKISSIALDMIADRIVAIYRSVLPGAPGARKQHRANDCTEPFTRT